MSERRSSPGRGRPVRGEDARAIAGQGIAGARRLFGQTLPGGKPLEDATEEEILLAAARIRRPLPERLQAAALCLFDGLPSRTARSLCQLTPEDWQQVRDLVIELANRR